VRPLIVADFPTHYTTPLFTRLQAEQHAQLLFFSDGSTREYWPPHLAKAGGDLAASTHTGRRIAPKVMLNPGLAKAVWTSDFDVVLMELSGRAEIATTFSIAKLRKKPFLLWNGLWTHPSTPFHRFTWPLTRSMYRRTDAFVVYGSHVKRFLVGNGVCAERIFVAEHSIDNDTYAAAVDPGKVALFRQSVGAGSRPLVLAVARLVPEKGLDDLIAAAALLPDLNPLVTIVGTGELERKLSEHAAALGLDVRLVGAVRPANMPIAYASADVFVLPSVTTPTFKEPWGLAINEAMCQSVPVIATDAVGAVAGGLVIDDVTGVVVPEHDRARLASALRRLLTSPEERERLGRAGRERVAQNTHAAMASVFAKAFDYALTAKSRRGASKPV
jgi:glycosyltransferase involved in cell wall biosynthesis